MAKIDRWEQFKSEMASLVRQGAHDLAHAVLGPLDGVTEPGTPGQLPAGQLMQERQEQPERKAPEMEME